MSQLVKKEVCRCINCGNEAEMVFTCTLPDSEPGRSPQAASASGNEKKAQKVKASGTCSHCGNEADMWIDI